MKRAETTRDEPTDEPSSKTRSTLRREYLLHTPDAFVRTPMPAVDGGVAIVHCSPRLGARFIQYTAEFPQGGSLGAVEAQRFCWVHAGELQVAVQGTPRSLGPGGFCYQPEGSITPITAQPGTRLTVIEKPYEALYGVPHPEAFIGLESSVEAVALNGDPNVKVRSLIPAALAHDFAVNTMTYAAGAALAQVEVHVMEHGLMMLEGTGPYRLSDDWHMVQAGDFIWMAPYCPQWFKADATGVAKYLIYKDWNRSPQL